MYNKYDINLLGNQLHEIRTNRYKQNPEKYYFCKSQESLAKKLGCERRTICNWENGKFNPDIEQVLNLCNTLDCDMDYLLGVSDYPIKSANEAANYTGIEYENIISITNNASLQTFLNYMLSSDEFNTVITDINNAMIEQFISSEILSSYKAPLMNHIRSAYAKFYANISILERTPEKVRDFLKDEFPFHKFNESSKETLNTFLHKNLSSDRIHQIMLNNNFSNITDEHMIYNAFISDTILCTYEIMEYKHNHEIKMYQFAHVLLNIVNVYITKQCENKRNELKVVSKNIKEALKVE